MISDSTIDLIRTFVRERDWDQYHAPGNLAKSVSIEAAELLECFQWNDQPREGDLEHIHEEIADVMIYCIMLANKLNLDLDDIIHDKMRKNSKKYPVEPVSDRHPSHTTVHRRNGVPCPSGRHDQHDGLYALSV